MPEIIHRIGIEAPPERVYRVLATRSGLINWWTWHVKGEPAPGAMVSFGFADGGQEARPHSLETVELAPGRAVRWRCRAGPEEWIGTDIHFELSAGERETILMFRHAGWREQSDFMAHCSCKWAAFLLSLKGWVEDGRGTPYPEDRRISSWG